MNARRLATCAAIILAACSSDSPDECGPTASCVPVSGLRVDSARIVTTSQHPVTGRGVAPGDSLTVRYTVTNTGRAASSPRTVQLAASVTFVLEDTVPALPPGQSLTRTQRLPVTAHYHRPEAGDVTALTVQLDPAPDDAEPGDDHVASDSVHVRLPILALEFAPASTPRVRANEPFAMQLTVRNLSAIAPATNIQLRHCLWDFDVACTRGNWALFGTAPLADLAPGETRVLAYTLSIPPESTYFDSRYTYWLGACITPADADAPYADIDDLYFRWRCDGGFFLEVWPDFEACPPALLGNGPVTLAAPNCGFYPPADPPVTSPHRIFVWALDALAGVTYQVSGLPGPVNDRGDPVADLDPAGDRLRVARSGRYYFVTHAQAGPRTGRADPIP